MRSNRSQGTILVKRPFQNSPQYYVNKIRPRTLDIALAALSFFLGLTVSVSPFQPSHHVEERGMSFIIFPSAVAGKENGKGKGLGLSKANGVGNGNGNAVGNTTGAIGGSSANSSNGLGNTGSGSANNSSPQGNRSNGLPLPPGLMNKGDTIPSAAQGAYVRSLNPTNQIPEFKADDEGLSTDEILILDEFDTSEIDYLKEFSENSGVQGSLSEDMTGVALTVDLENQATGEISVNTDIGQGTNGLAVGLAKRTGGDIGASDSASVSASANANASANGNGNSSSGNNGRALGLEKQASGEIAVNANGNGNGNSGNNGRALGIQKQLSGEIAVKSNGNGVLSRIEANNNALQAGLGRTATAAAAVEASKNSPSSGSIFGPDGPPDTYSANEVLVENLDPAGKERARQLGFRVEEERYGGSGDERQYDRSGEAARHGRVSRLIVPRGMTVPQARDLLRIELPGQNVHLNRIYRMLQPAINDEAAIEHQDSGAAPCTNDRCYGRQIVQWKEDLAKCASKVKIGVIDTHVDLKHDAFAGQKIHQETFVPVVRQVAESGHGTSVLALLAGRPDSNTPGLLPDAEFFVASIFFTGDDGSVQTDTVTLLKAMHWMDRSGVQLINLSFSGPKDSLLEMRFSKLRNEAGMLFAAAAGNEGLAAGPSYPAAYAEVIAVTAVDKKMRIYPSANRGEYIDIAAPGVRIWTALPDSRAGFVSGTSFAAPFMTAMLAIEPPEALRLPKDDLLNQMKAVPLDVNANKDSLTYGRGLLQAPGECPTAPSVAKGWAPVTDVSLK